jgi:hypothetical protein
MMYTVSGYIATSGAIGATSINDFSESPQRKGRS